jgi:hypothetical protein
MSAPAVTSLFGQEGFVQKKPPIGEAPFESREQIALQVSRHDDQFKSTLGQWERCQVGDPPANRQAALTGRAYCLEADVDAKQFAALQTRARAGDGPVPWRRRARGEARESRSAVAASTPR